VRQVRPRAACSDEENRIVGFKRPGTTTDIAPPGLKGRRGRAPARGPRPTPQGPRDRAWHAGRRCKPGSARPAAAPGTPRTHESLTRYLLEEAFEVSGGSSSGRPGQQLTILAEVGPGRGSPITDCSSAVNSTAAGGLPGRYRWMARGRLERGLAHSVSPGTGREAATVNSRSPAEGRDYCSRVRGPASPLSKT
jgi:hypothetical protein